MDTRERRRRETPTKRRLAALSSERRPTIPDGSAFQPATRSLPFDHSSGNASRIIGIVAARREPKEKPATPRLCSRWANDRVISANQIGDCLTATGQKGRRVAGGRPGPIYRWHVERSVNLHIGIERTPSKNDSNSYPHRP